MRDILWIVTPVFLVLATIASRWVWKAVSGTSLDNKQRAELRREVLTATDDLLKRMQ